MRLDENSEAVFPFSYDKEFFGSEDYSYWGITGFALVLPLVIFTFLKRDPFLLPLAIASVVFFLCQVFSGPYDPWRGRYFMQMAPFALPVLCYAWDARRVAIKVYVLAVILFACFTSFSVIVWRWKRPLVPAVQAGVEHKPVFQKTREEQLAASRLSLLEDIIYYEKTVPEDAVVVVHFPGNMFEYVLFGEKCTRTVIPFPDLQEDSSRLPGNVDFVIFYDPRCHGHWIIRRVAPGESTKEMLERIDKELSGKNNDIVRRQIIILQWYSVVSLGKTL